MLNTNKDKNSRRDFLIESGKTALATGLVEASVGQAHVRSTMVGKIVMPNTAGLLRFEYLQV